MEAAVLEALLAEGESDHFELKESFAGKEEICQTICAFANDFPNHQTPAYVVIGVNDRGDAVGAKITDRLLQQISNIRSDGNIQPIPALEVAKVDLRGNQVAVIAVHPSNAPPVRFRQRTYIRVGPTTRVATAAEEATLSERRRSRDVPFDIRSMPSATIADLDLAYFDSVWLSSSQPPDVLAQNARSAEQQLASLRFTTGPPDNVPTTLGILAVGKDVREYVPGAYVQFVRFAGLKLTDPVKDQKEIDGPLRDILEELDETLRVHISTASEPSTQAIEVPHPDYPLEALRQLVRNAILHRTYEETATPVRLYWFDDRIEIHSPGGPFGLVTRENFGEPGITDYRNPNLAAAMKDLGYIQRFGMGIPLAEESLRDNGNPGIEFNAQEAMILVTVRPRQ